jgi:hypothetical protein
LFTSISAPLPWTSHSTVFAFAPPSVSCPPIVVFPALWSIEALAPVCVANFAAPATLRLAEIESWTLALPVVAAVMLLTVVSDPICMVVVGASRRASSSAPGAVPPQLPPLPQVAPSPPPVYFIVAPDAEAAHRSAQNSAPTM